LRLHPGRKGSASSARKSISRIPRPPMVCGCSILHLVRLRKDDGVSGEGPRPVRPDSRDRPALRCAVLVSRRLCEEAGLMDRLFFCTWTRSSGCCERKRKDSRHTSPQKAVVWHKVSATVGKEHHPDAFYYGIRNTLYALNAHEPAPSALQGCLRNLLIEMIFLFSVFKLRSGVWEGFRATLDGFKDYRSSRMGRRGSDKIPA